MTPVSMAFLMHFGERSLFVAAGLLCLWLGYRLMVAAIEFFQKLSERAAHNTQTATDTLKRVISEAKQTLARISEAETKARREKREFTLTIMKIAESPLEKIPEIQALTAGATHRVDGQLEREFESIEKWKAGVSTVLHEMSAQMERSIPPTVNQNPHGRFVLGSWIFVLIGVLLLLFAAIGPFPLPKLVSREIFGHRADNSHQPLGTTTTTTLTTVR